MMTLDSFMLLRFVPLFSKLHPCGFLTWIMIFWKIPDYKS
jgi:hypothetical protein